MARKESWISALPIVLMGIRSMPNCSNFFPFYAVTGAQMLLPQLMINTENTETVTQNFTRELHKTMAKFDLTDFSNREKSTKTSYVPDQLQTCDKVWIRIDRVRKPLEAPNSGPYMVLERTPKYFLIETNLNMHTQVSIDRLKPYIENKQKCTQNATTNTNKKSESLPPEKVQEHKMKTRTSGRTVTWKKDNEYIYYQNKKKTKNKNKNETKTTTNKTKQKLRLLVGEYCSITSLTKVSKWAVNTTLTEILVLTSTSAKECYPRIHRLSLLSFPLSLLFSLALPLPLANQRR